MSAYAYAQAASAKCEVHYQDSKTWTFSEFVVSLSCYPWHCFMAYIEIMAGADLFQQGYNAGFYDGLYQKLNDPANTALDGFEQAYWWRGGYTVGFKCGREYRLARWAATLLREQDEAKHLKEQRRLKQKQSSVVGFLFWSLIDTLAHLTQFFKAVW